MASLTDMRGMNKGMIGSALTFLLGVRAENTWEYTPSLLWSIAPVGTLPVQCCPGPGMGSPPYSDAGFHTQSLLCCSSPKAQNSSGKGGCYLLGTPSEFQIQSKSLLNMQL